MFILNVKQFMADRGIKHPFSWMLKRGIAGDTATKILTGKYTRTLPVHALEILCTHLWCTPNDLLIWKPEHETGEQKHHPLQALKPKEQLPDINSRLQTLTPEQLRELNKVMDGMGK